MIKKVALIFYCIIPALAFCQPIKFGLSLPYAIKKNVIATDNGDAYSILSSYGLVANLHIAKGEEDEHKIFFEQAIGIYTDKNAYTTNEADFKVGVHIRSLLLQSSIGIPTKNESINMLFGIGTNISLLRDYFSSGNISSTVLTPIKDNVRRNFVVPHITIATNYHPNPHLNYQLFIRQHLINYFDKNSIIIFENLTNPVSKNVSYIPTMLGISVGYLF